MRWLWVALLGLALVGGATALWLRGSEPAAPSPAVAESRLSVMALLSDPADSVRFPTVDRPRPFEFPADHGAHPEYRHEWWYLTGNLETSEGRHFGYQVTFFRFNLGEGPPRESHWAADQVYMAHFAVTDTEGGHFHHSERFARAALGLAGARAAPFRVWLDDWRMQGAEAALFPLTVSIADQEAAVTLSLTPEKPHVLQGDRGYSRKGPEAGNASHYYSYTRIATEGQVEIEGERFTVTGESWLDREWGSSALGDSLVGWDWFSLQLDDGRDLMFFHLRQADGGIDPLSHGVLVEPDGRSRRLSFGDVDATPLRHWRSPATGVRYPVAWRLRIADEQLDLRLTPRIDAQELNGTFRYWEGALRIEGQRGDRSVTGHGYMELTGYEND